MPEYIPANDNRFTPDQLAKIEIWKNMPELRERLNQSGLEQERGNDFIRDVYYQVLTQNSDISVLTKKYPDIPAQTIELFMESFSGNDHPPEPPSPAESGVVIPMRPPETLNVRGETVEPEQAGEDRLAA